MTKYIIIKGKFKTFVQMINLNLNLFTFHKS
jgi:hypothetical protein